MTTNPEDGMRAIGELENGRYHRLLERVADILEMKLTMVTPSHVNIWRNPESTSTFPDYTLTPTRAQAFLYGLAVGIQGDWTP